jgi:GPH family glycoside/pentoside/hexuronide:cation symporter
MALLPLSRSCSVLFQKAQISGLVAMSSYVGLFLFIPFVGKIVTKFGKKEAITAAPVSACLLMY